MYFDTRYLIFTLALLLTSCGEPGPESGTRSQATTLYRGNGGEPASLDPALAEDIHAFNILVDTHEGLLVDSPYGDLVNGVAEEWSVTDDGLVYSFRLRANARWSNGDTVTANDFVRSLQRVVDPETASAYAYLLAPIRGYDDVVARTRPPSSLGVRAIDNRSLEIQLASPASHFPALLALPVAFPVHASLDETVSNGAYSLVERRPDDRIRLEKNAQYWNADAVDIDEVVYYPIVDPVAEYNAYRTGDLDVTHNIPTELFADIRENLGDEVQVAPTLALYYIAFDLTEAPFDDHQLREALNLATDRETLVKLLGRGEEPAYGIVPPGIAPYNGARFNWINEPQARREERARDLYAAAGYSDEYPLRIKFLYDAGGIHERVAVALSAMWQDKLGLVVELEMREWQYFLESRDKREDWDLMRFAWFGDYNDPMTFLEIFDSTSEQNLPRYINVRFDAAIAAAAKNTDQFAARTQLAAAEKALIDDHPLIPVYFFVSKHLVKPHVHGFESNVVDRHPSQYLQKSVPAER